MNSRPISFALPAFRPNDFNGDGRSDILWRNDSGALAEWLMNGNTVISALAPSSNGMPITPDSSFVTQAKPTDFA